MAKNVTLLAAIFLIVLVQGIYSLGSFSAYNSEAPQEFPAKRQNKLNEIEESTSDDEQLVFRDDIGDEGGNVKHPLDHSEKIYRPTWSSLDSRPLPAWYDQSKIGIFIHWGVFSVPAIASEWFWKQWKDGNNETKLYMEQNFKPNTTYQELAPHFTAQLFDPYEWANLFQKSGAKYVVLTSKHHEGFTLWPSRYSFSWNAMDVGPHRDLVGDLASAVRNTTNLKFGLYHSLYEWFNPLWLHDTQNNYRTNEFVRFKTLPELYELVNAYKPEIVWSDGDWEATDTYWQSKEFLTWLYNQSPVKSTVVTNDRWGQGVQCKHGGYFTCRDRYNPGVLQAHKWENCMTLDKVSWGYRRNAKIEDYLTPEELMTTIVESVSCGGNVLVNVGPTREGIIPPIQEERLLQMGEWLEINGEAIYGSVPYLKQKDIVTPSVWYTMSEDSSRIYGLVTKWPGASITLEAIADMAPGLNVKMLGYNHTLEWNRIPGEGIVVTMPRQDEIRSKWVWTLVFYQ